MVQVGFKSTNIRNYKRLSYKWWYAIAELVDNSTQAYFNNREILDESYKATGIRLEVNVDHSDGKLTITDNSMGMDSDDLGRAMNFGEAPADPNGRSKYGLGMKTSACWIGNEWKITTSKLGMDKRIEVTFNVDLVAEGNLDLPVEISNEDPNEHYTIIEITDFNRSLANKTIGKIKEHLASIYRRDLSDGILILSYKDDPLEWELFTDNAFLEAGDSSIYKQELKEFEINGKKVWGWIGILDPGIRKNAGFALIQNNRVIYGQPTAWRPEDIFGENSNNLLNQRLVGEIHLDNGFEVSHTKDDINWNGDEEKDLVDEIKRQFSEYITRANTPHTSVEISGPTIVTLKTAVSNVQTTLQDPRFEDHAAKVSREVLNKDEERIAKENAMHSEANSDGELLFEMQIQGIDVKVKQSELYPLVPYFTQEGANQNSMTVHINILHDYFRTLNPNSIEAVEQYILQAVFDALAQKMASRNNRVDHDTISSLKDGFLRAPFVIMSNDE